MRCKKMPASTILSLFLSILMLLPNCMVLADDVDPGNSESPGNLTIVKYLAGTASAPPTTGFKVRVTPAGSGSAIDADIDSIVAKDITLAPGNYTVNEFETLSADLVEYSTDGANWSPGPGNVTVVSGYITTVYIRNTFNAKTGDLNVIKSFAGTYTSPPTSGFIVSLAPLSGGAPFDKPIAKGDNLIAGLAIDNYTIVETVSVGADKVEYSTDGTTWSSGLGPVAVAPGSTPTTVYIRNTFNIPTGDPAYTGNLNVIKSFAGTNASPPTSGFIITLTPSGGGAPVDKPIVSGPNSITGLATGDYSIVETGSNGADNVEYSLDDKTWNDSLVPVAIAAGSTTTIYIRNTFNIPTGDPTYTGDLNVIKVLAGTNTSPPSSGFMISLTPASGGASINKSIASGPNLIAGLAIDNYALVETGTNGAGNVEYSFDNATWSTAPGSVPIAPGSTTIYYIRNTFNDGFTDNQYTDNNPIPPRQPVDVPDQPQVLEPKKEIVNTLPLEPIIVPDPLPELPYTGAAGMDMTWLGLLLAAGGMAIRRFRS